MNELVSILIPAYNAEKWIGDTVRSALNQTWPNIEVIVVDDGSQDRTVMAAHRYAAGNLKVVTQANKGAAAARNHAYSLAQGDWIQWLDADDLLAPEKIESQLRSFRDEADPMVLLNGAFGSFYFNPRKAKFNATALWRDLGPLEWMLTRFRHAGTWMNPACWLVSRELSDQSGPWNEALSFDDDGEFFCRMVKNSHGVKFIPAATCYYRKGNTGSLSSSKSREAVDSLIRSMALCIRHMLALEDTPRTREACFEYLNHSIRSFQYFFPEVVEKASVLAKRIGYPKIEPSWDIKYTLSQRLVGHRISRWLKKTKWNTYILLQKADELRPDLRQRK
jgi:glycosyltransferase involved in cell wall biosynthesis